MSKKDKEFRYVLTIAYKHGQDQCEYIEEKIVSDDNDTSW